MFFELYRRQPVDVSVLSSSVVGRLDVLEDFGLGLLTIHVDSSLDALALEELEVAGGNRVIVAVAAKAVAIPLPSWRCGGKRVAVGLKNVRLDRAHEVARKGWLSALGRTTLELKHLHSSRAGVRRTK